ncbi:2-keto-4-pentenoate hydratase/2-oxohepta-3-ene-1,7-dioic acid hydratase (catechol pathway) [Modicisalibacter muralis]|uniref:2-keto-4-pentenoate hydratase/2-oxohepta-3-ene-1,7-dioic acid hydratase (Catechol pathway) n=1 Tax=Modicisalibacter muralis TaxID=119000 RepID=A0A1G9QEH2_9GAMM|nr:fumarylacetoacetate hydrolase family protein [Halomonas muralis]SDM08867.1 2-keto-4-pentenoate hydratase/2-oxohepta-3-ene-1,7-dioic acid hydratase (catechol pathway) [Halomonas muralis]
MRFVPHFSDGRPFSQALGKIVCIGRNYAEHARELDNPVPSAPLLFIKPATSAVSLETSVAAPFDRGDVHFETELALLIGETLSDAAPQTAARAVVGVGLALDLTLRDVQARLKEKGHPWEIAKSFDGACPLSSFVAVDTPPDWNALTFSLDIDGERRQTGHGSDMLFAVPALLAEMSQHFTLEPGDVVLTGTPAGVGPLPRDGELRFALSLAGSPALELTTRTAG